MIHSGLNAGHSYSEGAFPLETARGTLTRSESKQSRDVAEYGKPTGRLRNGGEGEDLWLPGYSWVGDRSATWRRRHLGREPQPPVLGVA